MAKEAEHSKLKVRQKRKKTLLQYGDGSIHFCHLIFQKLLLLCDNSSVVNCASTCILIILDKHGGNVNEMHIGMQFFTCPLYQRFL